MTFEEVCNQTIALLQRQGRMSYRTLKRQFDLAEAYVKDVKLALIEVSNAYFGHAVRAPRVYNRSLAWERGPPARSRNAQAERAPRGRLPSNRCEKQPGGVASAE
ncbi:MAG TPA: hypothetical protein VIH59_28350 [Candidatus Tectomicrobia bacterium]|jgi:hypothetical protein